MAKLKIDGASDNEEVLKQARVLGILKPKNRLEGSFEVKDFGPTIQSALSPFH